MRAGLCVVALAIAVPLHAEKQDDGGYILTRPSRNLEQIEALYAEIPPVTYQPPTDRWAHLPKTQKRLRDGGTLRVVMLGDSIINDTARSTWQLLLQKQNPKLQVNVTTCVRGSTGCWWYREAGRVQKYVLDHKPDLVIIGGISQRGDLAAIRDVIGQIRAHSQTEFLLMTGAFGRDNPITDQAFRTAIQPQDEDYRARLMKLAKELRCGFLDMRGAWGAYLRKADKPLDWFKRDAIHANGRGEQILGRVLARFLMSNK